MKRRTRYLLVLVLAAVLVNLPLLHSTWTDQRVERSGVDVHATVVEHRHRRRPAPGDLHVPGDRSTPTSARWQADVDAATYERAVATGELEVPGPRGRPVGVPRRRAGRRATPCW